MAVLVKANAKQVSTSASQGTARDHSLVAGYVLQVASKLTAISGKL